MSQYKGVYVKLSNSQLNKLKSGISNTTTAVVLFSIFDL